MLFSPSARYAVSGLLLVLCANGCKYEPPQFESNLGLNIPCIPTIEFYSAVEAHLSQEIVKFAEPEDRRQGVDKYRELTELFDTASSDISRCLVHSSGLGEKIQNDHPYGTFYMNLSRMRLITVTYETFEKPWSNADVELLLEGLRGLEIEADLSWLEAQDCIENCAENNITRH